MSPSRPPRASILLVYELLGPAILGAMIYELLRPEVVEQVTGAIADRRYGPTPGTGRWILRALIALIYCGIWFYLKRFQRLDLEAGKWKTTWKRAVVIAIDLAGPPLFAVAFALVGDPHGPWAASAVVGVIALLFMAAHLLRLRDLGGGPTEALRAFRDYVVGGALLSFLAAIAMLVVAAIHIAAGYQPWAEGVGLSVALLCVLAHVTGWGPWSGLVSALAAQTAATGPVPGRPTNPECPPQPSPPADGK